ncbi:triadin-like [Raphanus sativus]|nr:triadin-like [Raphanus sativus]
MVSKESIEELFPEWSCQPDDPQLVSLITDIHAGRFVKGFWKVHGNAKGKGNEKNEGEAAATGKGSSEEEDNKYSGNNTTLTAIASTLDKISRKFDLMDERYKKPLVDQKLIDDMVKAVVEKRLKVMGIGKNPQNKDNLSNVAAEHKPEPLSSPQPNTQQKSVCSPLLAETPGKDMRPRNILSKELDKERGMKRTLAMELDFLYVSPAKATKDEDLRRRSTRNHTVKDEDAEDKKKAVLKRKEKAAAKRKAAELMKQKLSELRKPKQAELMNEEHAELKNEKQTELMNEGANVLEFLYVSPEKATKAEDLRCHSTRIRTINDEDAEEKKAVQAEAVLKRKGKAAFKRKSAGLMNEEYTELKNEEQAELKNEEHAEVSVEVLTDEDAILSESPIESQELVKSAILKEYWERTPKHQHQQRKEL